MKQKWPQRLKTWFSKLWQRFPEAVICLGVILVSGIVNLAMDNFLAGGVTSMFFGFQGSRLGVDDVNWWHYALSFIYNYATLGLLWSVSWRLWWESRDKKPKIWQSILFLVAALALSWVWQNWVMWLPEPTIYQAVIWQKALLIAILLSSWLWLPMLGGRRRCASLAIKIGQQAFLSGLFYGLINAGIMVALALVSWLLNVELFEIMPYVLLIVSTVVAIPYFLATFPAREENLVEWKIPAIWKVIGIYIGGPLLVLYDVIIYIYNFGLLFNDKWMENGVVNFVLWFALISILWLFLARGWQELKTKKWWQLGRKIFTLSLIPLLLIAGWALLIRVGDYGWTYNRWLVAAGVIWGLGAIGMLLAKKIGRLKIRKFWLWIWLAIVLTATAMVGPIGEWRAESREMMTRDIDRAEEIDETKSISFYLSRKPRNWVVQDYDLLLTTTTSSQRDTTGVENFSLASGEVTYVWPETLSQMDEAGVARVGELVIWQNDQEIYRVDLTPILTDLNQACEAQKDQPDKNYFGCRSKYANEEQYQTLLSQLIWTDENDHVQVKFYLLEWSGDYYMTTGEQFFDEIEAKALVRLK